MPTRRIAMNVIEEALRLLAAGGRPCVRALGGGGEPAAVACGGGRRGWPLPADAEAGGASGCTDSLPESAGGRAGWRWTLR